jgi:hypothetical protein
MKLIQGNKFKSLKQAENESDLMTNNYDVLSDDFADQLAGDGFGVSPDDLYIESQSKDLYCLYCVNRKVNPKTFKLDTFSVRKLYYSIFDFEKHKPLEGFIKTQFDSIVILHDPTLDKTITANDEELALFRAKQEFEKVFGYETKSKDIDKIKERIAKKKK